MTARVAVLLVTIGATAAIAACKGDVTRTRRGPDTYLDVYAEPDLTCDPGQPFCVSSVSVDLTPIGSATESVCFDVAPMLGAPATNFGELSILAGAAIAGGLPSSGVVGIYLRADTLECGLDPQAQATPVLEGYAEIELLEEDQQLFIPIGCAQPILPCATPTATPMK